MIMNSFSYVVSELELIIKQEQTGSFFPEFIRGCYEVCGDIACRGRHRQGGLGNAEAGIGGRVAVRLAVGIVGGGLDEDAVRADDV